MSKVLAAAGLKMELVEKLFEQMAGTAACEPVIHNDRVIQLKSPGRWPSVPRRTF